MATFKGNEFFCYDLSMTPIQSSTDEITLSFRTLQRNGLMLHTGKSADYVNLSLKSGAVWLVINLGSGAFEALVEPVNGKFNDNAWHDVKVTRNLRQVRLSARFLNAFAWILITNRCAGRRESLWKGLDRTSLAGNGLRSTVLPNDCGVIPDRSGSSGVCFLVRPDPERYRPMPPASGPHYVHLNLMFCSEKSCPSEIDSNLMKSAVLRGREHRSCSTGCNQGFNDRTLHVRIDKEQKRVLTEQTTAHDTERDMEKRRTLTPALVNRMQHNGIIY